MGKYSRKAVVLAGVLAVTLIGVAAVGLWAGAVGPASTDAALVDPAVAMDPEAGVCIDETLEDLGPATPLNASPGYCANGCAPPWTGCHIITCDPCCSNCQGRTVCTLIPKD